MLHAVIMAGGSGTRFWPESRGARPKQLLSLLGERTMIQSTVDRVALVVPRERILIVTGETLLGELKPQLPQLPDESFLGEPCRRDTAPCIALAALRIVRDDPEAIMAVMPADHVISPERAFARAIEQAAALVAADEERIVTLGVQPTYPAESFGYIERGEKLSVAPGEAAVYRVKQFREKPKADVARQYVAAGSYYWNSGIFVWKASAIIAELTRREPEMIARLRVVESARGTPEFAEVFAREFAALRAISIDYAVMEHATNVVVIEVPFSWDDLGSWQAIARLQGVDEAGNTIYGKHLGVQTQGTIVRSQGGHLVVTLGVTDLIVVHTPDATLVANKNDEESIRRLVDMIRERGWQEHL